MSLAGKFKAVLKRRPGVKVAEDESHESGWRNGKGMLGLRGAQDNSLVVDSVGFTEEPNLKWRGQMEDGHVICPTFRGSGREAFFGVYDGHGGRGAVDDVQKDLHDLFGEEIEAQGENPDPAKAFNEAYKRMDVALLDAKCLHVGTTAVTVYVTLGPDNCKKLFVANCGDTRAVLCHSKMAERLTYDHKATDPEEARRVNESGGQIVSSRVGGVLSVSRALGDHQLKRLVISTPHISERTLTSDDAFLILACDGVWDVTTDEEAVRIVMESLSRPYQDTQAASKALVTHALRKDSRDNISVMIIKFRLL